MISFYLFNVETQVILALVHMKSSCFRCNALQWNIAHFGLQSSVKTKEREKKRKRVRRKGKSRRGMWCNTDRGSETQWHHLRHRWYQLDLLTCLATIHSELQLGDRREGKGKETVKRRGAGDEGRSAHSSLGCNWIFTARTGKMFSPFSPCRGVLAHSSFSTSLILSRLVQLIGYFL